MTASTAPPLSGKLNLQLSVMMFLQYAIWGAWLPLFFSFLFEGRSIPGDKVGYLFSIAAVGALAAPFIAGQIADRYFNTEKFLGISHIVGACMVWWLAYIESYTGLVIFGVLYSLVYAPTLALTNSLAFHHLPDRDRDFGKVRVWGTVGWIAVGIGLGQWLNFAYTPPAAEAMEEGQAIYAKMDAETKAKAMEDTLKGVENPSELTDAQKDDRLKAYMAKKAERVHHVAGMADSFRLSALLGVILGIFCFMLPKTPPQKGKAKFAPWEALSELKKMPLLPLFLISFPLSCVHQFYFVHTAGFLGNLNHPLADNINLVFGVGGGGLMTVGQIFEIVVLAFMPLLAKKLGRKNLLLLGLVAYVVRFAVFAFISSPAVIVPALALHGICFGCFFFVAFMIVDEETPANVRASAQGLYNLVIIGLGTIVGNAFAGFVAKISTTKTGLDYTLLFSIPMWVSVACLLALFFLYPWKSRKVSASPEQTSA